MNFRNSRFSFLWFTIFISLCCVIFFKPVILTPLERGESISDYIMNAYSIADGLPQNSVICLIQARDGYLWFGTRSGLVRFDGVIPRLFNRWNTWELKNDTILSLCEDGEGCLWIGTDGGGFVRKRKGKWKLYTSKDGLSNDRVRVILNTRAGDLWVGTDYGLNLMRDGKFNIFTTEHGLASNAINALAESRDGGLWVGTEGDSLNLLKNGIFHAFAIRSNVPGTEITALHEDRSGILWIGTESGLYRFKNGKVEQYRSKKGTFTGSIRTIAGDSDGSLWIGTYGSGLVQLKDDLFSSLSTDNGFLDDFIHSILEDHEGSLWVGTYTSGLVQLQDSRVVSISRENGLPENLVYTVYEDRQGYLWTGTRDRGLCKCQGNRVLKVFSSEEGLAGSRVRALCQDKEGSLWVGTSGSGLSRLKEGKFSHYTTTEGLSSDNVKVIFQDSSGALWVGTDNGLNRFREGTFTIYNRESGLPATHKDINVLLEDRSGNLLAGTRGGLIRFRDGEFHPMPAGNTRIGVEVLALYEDPGKNLWVGTNGSGLMCLRKGKLTVFTTGVGLYNNYIFSILEDDRGNLWMSSYRGVFRSAKKELQQFADNSIKKITSVFFDEKDGMKSSECVHGGQPAAWKTRDRQLCFTTVKGISIFNPSAIKANKKPPKVAIDYVLVDNEVVKKEDNSDIEFPGQTKMVEFHFTALSFKVPGRVRFKYRLDRVEKEWVDAQPRQKRTAYYINLRPEKYSFRVIASNNDGIWNQEGAHFDFKIKSSFFKQPGFFFLSIVVLVFALAGTSWFIIYKKRSKKKSEKYKTSALDAERAEEILPKLLDLMEKEKVYLDADLTLKKLSERLMIHYNHLSQIINEKLRNSFNDFVNKYRIEEAKKKLLDPREGKKTVLEIAYDTGFYSKSVFNTAFKKFTGMTPSQFRKKHFRE